MKTTRTPESQLSKQKGSRPVSIEREVNRQELSPYSGSFPQADQLELYEKICPGYATEFLEMAKKSQNHAQNMEKRSMDLCEKFSLNQQKYFGRGQCIGGILAFSAIVSGTIFCVLGHAVAGGSMIGAVLVALGGAFAWGKFMEESPGAASSASDNIHPRVFLRGAGRVPGRSNDERRDPFRAPSGSRVCL